MLNVRLSVLALTLIGFTATMLSGCSSTPSDPTAAWTPEKIYQEARDEVSAGAWDRAAMMFEKLEGRAAGTPLAQQAQIEKAYAQYRATEKIQAVATLDRFLKLHPASPAVDYALYLRGLVNFNDNLGLFSFITNQDLSERDQKAAKDSFESFKELTTRFPESKYAPDARQRMTYIVNTLASYEVHVGNSVQVLRCIGHARIKSRHCSCFRLKFSESCAIPKRQTYCVVEVLVRLAKLASNSSSV